MSIAFPACSIARFLRKRASVGVEPGVIGGGEIEYITRCSDLDARDAIALLSHSVRNTATSAADRVTWAVIDDSKPDTDQAVVCSRLSDLSRGQRLVLEVMADTHPATSSRVYEAYCERAANPVHDRTLRGWLPKLECYELMVKSGSEYEPVYEDREIALKEPGIMVYTWVKSCLLAHWSIGYYSDSSSPTYWSSQSQRASISRRPRRVSV